MGRGELLLILVVALLVVGPDKLPQAAKAIGKGIRDFRRHSQDLQSTLEQDEKLGEAVRELRSALRDDPLRFATRPTPRPAGTASPGTSSASTDAAATDAAAGSASASGNASASAPAGESAMGPPSIVPAAGTVAKQSAVAQAGAAPADARPDPRPSPPRSKVDDPPHG